MEFKHVWELVFISFLSQLLFYYLAKKWKLFLDFPKEERKIHKEPTPRTGGLGVLLTLLVSYLLKPFPLLGKLLVYSIPLVVSSIWEDLKRSSYKTRFLFMFITATITVLGLNAVVTYFEFFSIPYWIGVVFSIFALVGAINAYNIIDGLNGLSSSLALLGLLTYAYLSYLYGFNEILLLTIIVSIALVGFLILNFPFGKVFLGDTGSYFLGYTIGTISILIAGKEGSPVSPWSVLLIMFYPIWETVFSIFRRIKEGKNPFEPDKEHMHFLLLEFFRGKVWLTTLAILSFQSILDILVIFLHKQDVILIITLLIAVVFYWFLYKKLINQKDPKNFS